MSRQRSAEFMRATLRTFMYHGYVLAMANLHVLLAYPLLSVPSEAHFAELVGPEQGLTREIARETGSERR